MARRKKEPRSVHRANIAQAAQVLFMKKGIEAVTMDDIASAAGYSKATLYVYYKNKEELVGVLTLESMTKLRNYICEALDSGETTRERYDMICQGLVRYQEEFPFYFRLVLDKINVSFDDEGCLPEERETYLVGKRINEAMSEFVSLGVKSGELRSNIEVLPTIFSFWGMLSGAIELAASKEEYFALSMSLSKDEFLKYVFDLLYRSIENK